MSSLSADTNYLDPIVLKFAILDDKETKRLSVVKVKSSLTFDALGSPYPGGLYDSAMGPYHYNSDPCGTCNKIFNVCTGHIGHIDLTIPVYNPFFLSTVYKILRISCVECSKIQLSDFHKQIISLQLKLIDKGFIIEAQELELFKSNNSMVNQMENDDSDIDDKLFKYKKLVMSGVMCDPTSSMEQLKSSIVKAAFNCETKFCIHCKARRKRVQMSYGKLVFYVPKAEMVDF